MTANTTSPNADQITYWNEVSGAKWVANQVRLDRLMAPLGEALLAKAAATEGEHALDIGCGCGDISLRLAELVGSHGQRVLGVDISRPMLSASRGQARGSGAGLIAPSSNGCSADAMVHGFAQDAVASGVDVMVSRFGVMFFDDRPRAFANLRKAPCEPGGAVSLSSHGGRRREVEWMQAPMDWLAPLPSRRRTRSTARSARLRSANADATSRLLTEAGFQGCRTSDRLDRPNADDRQVR